MSMTSSMCVSMTGRPTRLQIANEQRRQRYDYLQTANEQDINIKSKLGDGLPWYYRPFINTLIDIEED